MQFGITSTEIRTVAEFLSQRSLVDESPKYRDGYQQAVKDMEELLSEKVMQKLYTVEIPNPNRADVSLALGLYNDGKVAIFVVFTDSWKYEKQYKLTEAEIKQDFEWAWQFAKEVEE